MNETKERDVEIRLFTLILLAASQLVFPNEASARRIIADNVTDAGTSATGCRKRKTSSFISLLGRSYHAMGIDSVHWIVRNGFIGGIHTGDNYGAVIVGESVVVEADTATILPSYRDARVHMETDYWAFFCGTAGGQLREIYAHKQASATC